MQINSAIFGVGPTDYHVIVAVTPNSAGACLARNAFTGEIAAFTFSAGGHFVRCTTGATLRLKALLKWGA